MSVLSRFTPDLEIYSIDEAFLGLPGFRPAPRKPCPGAARRRASMDRHPRIGRHRADQGRSPSSPITFREKRIRNTGAWRCCSMKRRRTRRCHALSSPICGGVAGRLAGAPWRRSASPPPLDLKRGDPRMIRERLGVVTMRLALELRGVPCLDLEARCSGPEKASWPRAPSGGRWQRWWKLRESGCFLRHARGPKKDAPAASGDPRT